MSLDDFRTKYSTYFSIEFGDIVSTQPLNFNSFTERFYSNWRELAQRLGFSYLSLNFLNSLQKRDRLSKLFSKWMQRPHSTVEQLWNVLKDINSPPTTLEHFAHMIDNYIEHVVLAKSKENENISFQWSMIQRNGELVPTYETPTTATHYKPSSAAFLGMGNHFYPFPTLLNAQHLDFDFVKLYLSFDGVTRDIELRYRIVEKKIQGKNHHLFHCIDPVPLLDRDTTAYLFIEEDRRKIHVDTIKLKRTLGVWSGAEVDLSAPVMTIDPGWCPLSSKIPITIESSARFSGNVSAFFISYGSLVYRREFNIVGTSSCKVEPGCIRTLTPEHGVEERVWVVLVDSNGLMDFTHEFRFKAVEIKHEEVSILMNMDLFDNYHQEVKLRNSASIENLAGEVNNNNNNSNNILINQPKEDALLHPELCQALLKFIDSGKLKLEKDNPEQVTEQVRASSPLRKQTLHEAASDGILWRVQECIAKDLVDIDSKRDGLTALHCAVFFNRIDITEYLLKKGAGVDLKDDEERETALHKAAFKQHFEICSLLLIYGASTTNKNMNKQTPEEIANSHLFSLTQLGEACLLSPATLPSKSNACLRVQHKALKNVDMEPIIKFGDKKGIVVRFSPPVMEVLCPLMEAGTVSITVEADDVKIIEIPNYSIIDRETWHNTTQAGLLVETGSQFFFEEPQEVADEIIIPGATQKKKRGRKRKIKEPLPYSELDAKQPTTDGVVESAVAAPVATREQEEEVLMDGVVRTDENLMANVNNNATENLQPVTNVDECIFILDSQKSVGKREYFTLESCIPKLGRRWIAVRLADSPVLYQRLYRVIGITSYEDASTAVLTLSRYNVETWSRAFPVEVIRGQRMFMVDIALRKRPATPQLRIMIKLLDPIGRCVNVAMDIIVEQKSKPYLVRGKQMVNKDSPGFLDLIATDWPPWMQYIIATEPKTKPIKEKPAKPIEAPTVQPATPAKEGEEEVVEAEGTVQAPVQPKQKPSSKKLVVSEKPPSKQQKLVDSEQPAPKKILGSENPPSKKVQETERVLFTVLHESEKPPKKRGRPRKYPYYTTVATVVEQLEPEVSEDNVVIGPVVADSFS